MGPSPGIRMEKNAEMRIVGKPISPQPANQENKNVRQLGRRSQRTMLNSRINNNGQVNKGKRGEAKKNFTYPCNATSTSGDGGKSIAKRTYALNGVLIISTRGQSQMRMRFINILLIRKYSSSLENFQLHVSRITLENLRQDHSDRENY